MKALKSVSFAVLCLSLITAFAFRPVNKSTKRFAKTWWAWDGTGSQYNPAKYVAYGGSIPPTTADCPGIPVSVVCCIQTDDIYIVGPNTGQPQVDVTNAGFIGNLIYWTLNNHDYIGREFSSDVVYLKKP